MRTTRWWMVAPLAIGLIVAACGDDEDATDEPTAAPASTEAAAEPTEAAPEPTTAPADPTDPPAEPTAEPAGPGDADAGANSVTLGEAVIALDPALCFFEEQPRAGLGGVFTHTAQAQGTTDDGQPLVLDLSRARAEDGTVEDDVIVDIGEPGADDAVSWSAMGPEGTIEFGDASASGTGIELTNFDDFEAEPVPLSFEVACR